jgi:hypothetical protein
VVDNRLVLVLLLERVARPVDVLILTINRMLVMDRAIESSTNGLLAC